MAFSFELGLAISCGRYGAISAGPEHLYDEKLVVTSWYSEDKTEITWDMLKGADGDPFVKGEAAEFDCFPLGSSCWRRW